MPISRSRPGWLVPAIAAFALAAACHAAFSPLGFNPTDDGFVLAYARRVLDGQFPHRDFISIRPAGSALLHLAEVAWGGDHVLLVSRWIVWLQFAWIAFAWTWAATRLRRNGATAIERVLLVLIAFALTVNTFPVMAWHTVDGLFLIAVAVVLATAGSSRARAAALVVVGAAALCKQSFVPMALAAPALAGWSRRPWAWLLALAPVLGYGAALWAAGGARDAVLQLGAQSDFTRAGILPYVASRALWAGLALGAASRGLEHLAVRAEGPRAAAAARIAAALIALGSLAAAARAIGSPAFQSAIMALFGVTLALVSIPVPAPEPGARRLAAAALIAAWSASISIGFAAPDLGAGALGVVLAVEACRALERGMPGAVGRWAFALGLAGIVTYAAMGFLTARTQRIYRDRPRAELTARLDGVFPGAAGLRTHPRLAEFLTDLGAWSRRLDGRGFAIVPDFAAWWITAARPNPMSIDWPQDTELATPVLLARAVGDLEARRGHVVVLVQKFELRPVGRAFGPLDRSSYGIVRHITSRWRKVGESEFFTAWE